MNGPSNNINQGDLVPSLVSVKRRKSKGRSNSNPLWVRKETRDHIYELLGRINQKDYGRKVRPNDLIVHAIKLVTPEDIKLLQVQSMSSTERFQKNYREYAKANGPIERDVYLGKLLAKEI